jgi:hypothetical protein
MAADAEVVFRLVIHRQARDGVSFAWDAFFSTRIGTHVTALAAGASANELSRTAAVRHAFLVRAATNPAAIDHATGVEWRAAGFAAPMARPPAAEPIATFAIATNRLFSATAEHARIAAHAVLAHLVPLAAHIAANWSVTRIAAESDAGVRADLSGRAASMRPVLLVPDDRAKLSGVLSAAKAA